MVTVNDAGAPDEHLRHRSRNTSTRMTRLARMTEKENSDADRDTSESSVIRNKMK